MYLMEHVQSTNRLKSTVVKRKGRGFSRTDEDNMTIGLKQVIEFDTLEQGTADHLQKSIEGWVVFVSGLNEEINEEELHDRFSEFGNIKDLKLPLDHRTGYAKGYALLKYQSFQEAKAAVNQMNGDIFMNCMISCDFAFTTSYSQ